MLSKIQALLLSIVLFFVGLIYGDTPVEIDYTVSINGTDIVAGDNVEIPVGRNLYVFCYCENTSRPFEGTDLHNNAHVSFYKYENGKKVYLSRSGISVDAVPRPILIKGGEKFREDYHSLINPDAEPGVYTMEVSVFGCTQIYENVITVVL